MVKPDSAIELHDSKVESITRTGDQVMVAFSEAYIHKYEGRPGIDSGTGWIQAAQLSFEIAEMAGLLPEFPCVIWHGSFKVDGKPYDLIPTDLEVIGDAEMDISFDTKHRVVIRGKSLKLRLFGETRFVEDLPWTSAENI